jgi:Recombination endonuclease VII
MYKDIKARRANNAECSRRYRLRHPERAKEANRKGAEKWRREHPEESKSQTWVCNLKRRYGFTPEAYDSKLKAQNNLCTMCGEPFDLSSKGTRPSLDHNHADGKLRDFIHSNCNVAIGLLKDDPKLCRLAAEYLEHHSLEEEVWKNLES